jgi:hypothetical protein
MFAWLRRMILRAVHRGILRQLPASEIHGLTVYGSPREAERIGRALELLTRLDPRRSRRVLFFARQIVKSEQGTHYDPDACALYFDFSSPEDNLSDALALVHEATHVYLLQRRQLKYVGPGREKHERICIREESALLRLYSRDLPLAEQAAFLSKWSQYHEASLNSRWWERSRWSRVADLVRRLASDSALPN